MAKMLRATIVDEKIAKAQERVVCAKVNYEEVTGEPRCLIEKHVAMRKDKLWDAVVSGDKSRDDIFAMLRSADSE